MKKDRNCATPYPVYPMAQNQIPQMMPLYQPNYNQMAQPNNQMYPMMQMPNLNMEQQLSNLNGQVTNLERRVSSLESIIGNTSNNYNNSNFQMM